MRHLSLKSTDFGVDPIIKDLRNYADKRTKLVKIAIP